ncbi:transposase [Micromonospora sp. WMMC415]|uniref:transposase n=1 Tax=Micromonospora sp. WMMC415 TaxID=2675222 RepID=UPI0012B4DD49|nr:transposase [Micromonospora sp. WMMC415]QGN47992.1 transposase [Micromonospora sp. WMMC415]
MTLSIADIGLGEDGLMGSASSPRADRPKRRTFTPEYKLAIVAEYDALTEAGARGALLRREGLYHSHIIEWRRARDAGTLSGPAPRPGRRPGKTAEQVENERLRRENERLQAELAKTRAALDVVGNAHALLGLLSESAEQTRDGRPRR